MYCVFRTALLNNALTNDLYRMHFQLHILCLCEMTISLRVYVMPL